jgi:hypothetical protein
MEREIAMRPPNRRFVGASNCAALIMGLVVFGIPQTRVPNSPVMLSAAQSTERNQRQKPANRSIEEPPRDPTTPPSDPPPPAGLQRVSIPTFAFTLGLRTLNGSQLRIDTTGARPRFNGHSSFVRWGSAVVDASGSPVPSYGFDVSEVCEEVRVLLSLIPLGDACVNIHDLKTTLGASTVRAWTETGLGRHGIHIVLTGFSSASPALSIDHWTGYPDIDLQSIETELVIRPAYKPYVMPGTNTVVVYDGNMDVWFRANMRFATPMPSNVPTSDPWAPPAAVRTGIVRGFQNAIRAAIGRPEARTAINYVLHTLIVRSVQQIDGRTPARIHSISVTPSGLDVWYEPFAPIPVRSMGAKAARGYSRPSPTALQREL